MKKAQNQSYTVSTISEAWAIVDKVFPTDYIEDAKSTANAGYKVYRSTAEEHFYDYICDLGSCLEVNLSDGSTVYVNIRPETLETKQTYKARITHDTNPIFSEIDTLARKAAIGTLKRIHAASGNETILTLYHGLIADLHKLDTQGMDAFAVAGANDGGTSDGLDCYFVAYEYLMERMAVSGMAADDVITVTLKNGKDKARTVYQWACVAVRRHVYNNGNGENHSKYTYIEDLRTMGKDGTLEEGLAALDRHYIRAGKYQDVGQEALGIGGADMTDTAVWAAIIEPLEFQHRDIDIIRLRQRGLSVSDIAAKMGVDHSAISHRLHKIQAALVGAYRPKFRQFKRVK